MSRTLSSDYSVNPSSTAYKTPNLADLVEDNDLAFNSPIGACDDDVPIVVEEPRINNLQVGLHLVKAAIGGGVLAMPAAVMKSGMVPGTVGIILISLLVIYCCNLLIESVQYLRRRATQNGIDGNSLDLDFYRSAKECMLLGPQWLQRNANWMAMVLQICILSGQFGFLSVCNQFVANNIKEVVETNKNNMVLDVRLYAFFVYLFLILLVFVKTLHYMSFLSAVANVMGIGSLFITFIYCFQHFQPIDSLPAFKSVLNIPNLFGTVLYAFEVITVLVPVENKMKDQSSLPGWNGVMATSLMIATAIYTAIGFYGYLAFGEDVKETIIYSMPASPWYYLITKPMYVIAILLSYALQFYVLFTILWDYLKPRLRGKTTKQVKIADAGMRVLLVTGGFLFSVAIPNVGILISITGASACAIMSIIAPAIMNGATNYHDPNNTPRRLKFVLIRNGIIIGLGVFGGIVGLITSIQEVVAYYSK